MSVAVVKHVHTEMVLKVCDDWDTADEWVNRSDWDDQAVSIASYKVFDGFE